MSKIGISHKMSVEQLVALDDKVVTLKAKNRSVLINHYIDQGIFGKSIKFDGPFAIGSKHPKPKTMAKKAAKKAVKKAAKKAPVAKKAAKKAAKRGTRSI